jgi:nitrate reductase NapE component
MRRVIGVLPLGEARSPVLAMKWLIAAMFLDLIASKHPVSKLTSSKSLCKSFLLLLLLMFPVVLSSVAPRCEYGFLEPFVGSGTLWLKLRLSDDALVDDPPDASLTAAGRLLSTSLSPIPASSVITESTQFGKG